MPEQNLATTNKKTVLDFMKDHRGNVDARLPASIDKERFFLGVMTAIQKNPDLLKCTPQSVLLAAYDAAEMGCSLSPALQLGWIIPYKAEAVFQPSYRFFIQRAYNTGDVKTFLAEVVYACDRFERHFAPRKVMVHQPGEDDKRIRDNAIGAYAFIEFKDGEVDFEFLTREQIDRHRNKSKQPNSMKWMEFWEEGWRITAIRVLAKRLPLKSRQMEELVEVVNRDALRELEEIAADRGPALPQRKSEGHPVADETISIPVSDTNLPAGHTAAEVVEAQAPVSEKTENHNGSGTDKNALFANGDADPYATPAEISDFWNKAFAAGWKKEEVVRFLKTNMKVSAPKDLRRSQLREALDTMQQGRP